MLAEVVWSNELWIFFTVALFVVLGVICIVQAFRLYDQSEVLEDTRRDLRAEKARQEKLYDRFNDLQIKHTRLVQHIEDLGELLSEED